MFSWGPILVLPRSVWATILWPITTLFRLACAMAYNVGILSHVEAGRSVICFPAKKGRTKKEFSFALHSFWRGDRLGINLTLYRVGDYCAKLHISIPYLCNFIVTLNHGAYTWKDSKFGQDDVVCWKIVFYLYRFFEIKWNFKKKVFGGSGFNYQWERKGVDRVRYKIEPVGKMRGHVSIGATAHAEGRRVTVEVVMEDIIPLDRQGIAKMEVITRRYTARAQSVVYVLKPCPDGIRFPSLVEASEEQYTFVTTAANSPQQVLQQYSEYLTRLVS